MLFLCAGRWNPGQELSGRSLRQSKIGSYRYPLTKRVAKQGAIWKRSTETGSRTRSKRSIHSVKRRPPWSSANIRGSYSLDKHSRSPTMGFRWPWSRKFPLHLTQSRAAKLRKVKSGGTYTMYHGTSCSAAQSIQSQGFRPSTGGMLGPCVYMSRDLQKTFYYAYTSLMPSISGCIVKATVNVGKVCKITQQGQANQQTWMNYGCDSAWVPPGSTTLNPKGQEESCIKDPTNITVIKVCTYSTVRSTNSC